MAYYWDEYVNNPEMKARLEHRKTKDELGYDKYELYDPVLDRVVVCASNSLVRFLK